MDISRTTKETIPDMVVTTITLVIPLSYLRVKYRTVPTISIPMLK